MGDQTEIEWADSTLNFAWGCTKVSAGCDKCYMFRLSKVFGKPTTFNPRKIANVMRDVRKLPDKAVVFVNSMTDTFHEDASDETILEWFKIMSDCPEHTWIVLTKRINRAYNFYKKYGPMPSNIWLGTSIENRISLHRLRKLKRINVGIRFVSFEPLLEDIGEIDLDGISWVIVGGESDFSSPRLFDPKWALNLLGASRRAGASFFYKQSGGKRKINGCWGTNLLGGRKYLEMPVPLVTKESTTLERPIDKLDFSDGKIKQTDLLMEWK